MWFAALSDFYCQTPCQGCISASKRVARNHGCGEAFSRNFISKLVSLRKIKLLSQVGEANMLLEVPYLVMKTFIWESRNGYAQYRVAKSISFS